MKALHPSSLASGLSHACLLLCLREVFLAGLGVSQCICEDCVYLHWCPGPLWALFLVAQSRPVGIGQSR